MLPVAVQDPLPGSYSSAEASGGLRLALLLPRPPATSTLPSGSSVAVWDWRGMGMLPVAVQDPLLGSYSSAEASVGPPPPMSPPGSAVPPATSTLPSGSSVAVWNMRGVTMLPVAVQDPLLGSYSSAEASALLLPVTLLLPVPPATSTLPSGSSVAVWDWRGVGMLPVAVQDPLFGSYSSAEARTPCGSLVAWTPPATSTLPSDSSVAVSWKRSSIIPPVAVHAGAPADGLAGLPGLELAPGVGLGLPTAGWLGLELAAGVGLGPPTAGWPRWTR